ncbi:hypothetical protein P3H80_10755 [Mycolicibacterium septicum]|uniref:hypothetical protein n=1 Tax=Mycolicibacterium septicum TaxID=98668 RepID=UPI0023E28437|nr:hypothetical protein [Mycolicibacterium septicum]MDF3337906.1 hypothetical protein [Mycolicibacterium septicum]
MVDAAAHGSFSDEDIAELASHLADSGTRLARDDSAADIASTGGVGSLSTLLCPIYLRQRGFRIPKIGVTGRPAGGVDVLQTIRGYNAHLDPGNSRDVLSHTGYFHLEAGEQWAPLDSKLFRYRQTTGAQSLAPLVIASILAKKLAAGVVNAGLDVRTAPYGNFGHNWSAARENAHRYIRVATLLGLRPMCALTDASQPSQPYIGRGEALVGLWRALHGNDTLWLDNHVSACRAISDAMNKPPGNGRTQADVSPVEVMVSLLETHETSWLEFEEAVGRVLNSPRVVVRAQYDGVISYDLPALRATLVSRQALDTFRIGQPMPDPAGVTLLFPSRHHVHAGEAIMIIRAAPDEERLIAQLSSYAVVHANRQPDASHEGIQTLEIIRA